MSDKKPIEKVQEKQKTSVTKKKKVEPIQYFHIDEFIAKDAYSENPQLNEIHATGFRIFMKGKSYQRSMKAFEKELQNYFKRKV